MADNELTADERDFLDRLEAFLKKDWEKSELDDREMIKEQLVEELQNM